MIPTRKISLSQWGKRRGVRAAVRGTSLIQQGHGVTLSGGLPLPIYSSARSWVPWLETFSFGAIRFPVWFDPTVYIGWEPSQVPGASRNFFGANLGVSGQTTQQILDRCLLTNGVTKSVYDSDFDFIFDDAGTNDIAPLTAVEIVNIRKSIINSDRGRGKLDFVLPIRQRASASWTTTLKQKANWANALLRDWVIKQDDLFWLDWNVPLVDGTSSIGEPRAGYLVDGIHDNPAGGMAIAWWMWHGQLWSGSAWIQDWAGLKTILHGYPSTPISSNVGVYSATENPFGNLHPNGFMLGTGGTATSSKGATGSVPTSCTLERSSTSGSVTVVGSVAARGDGKGNDAVMTYTAGGTAAELFYLRTGPSTVDISGLPNQWIEGSIDLDVSAYSDWQGQSLRISDDGNSQRTVGGLPFDNGTGTNFPLAAFPWAGRVFTPPLKLGPAATTATMRLETTIKGGGTGTPVVKASRFVAAPIGDPSV